MSISLVPMSTISRSTNEANANSLSTAFFGEGDRFAVAVGYLDPLETIVSTEKQNETA